MQKCLQPKRNYTNIQNLIFCIASLTFKNSSNSSQHWMNEFMTCSYVYLSTFLKDELFQILFAAWRVTGDMLGHRFIFTLFFLRNEPVALGVCFG